VYNLPPVIEPFGPFELNEAEPLSVTANATDPGSDDLMFDWTLEYGPATQSVHFNDGVGPDPQKSPWGTFPFSSEDMAAHTYGDDGVFGITLTVTDDDDGVATYSTTVTMRNVPPTIVDSKVFMLANITLRVAGEKWHDIILGLYEDGQEAGWAQVVRYPGSPDDQMVTVHDVEITLDRSFSAVAYYTPDDDPINGQLNGANPAWLIINWENGPETILNHTFNVQHNDTWVWTVDDFHIYAVNQIIHFTATATDPGSDDLTFTWDWGDGTPAIATTYFNDGIGPDSYPSPDGIYPFSATDSAQHIYSMAGDYSVTLTVMDDDGGMVNIVIVLVIP
jgi:PKD repeat protein